MLILGALLRLIGGLLEANQADATQRPPQGASNMPYGILSLAFEAADLFPTWFGLICSSGLCRISPTGGATSQN
jgi:hypothetical protein